jgi:hypothetical protein
VFASDVTELHSFAKGLQRDLAAVTAGLTLPGARERSKARSTA